jgi:hypothetical protein
MDACVPIDDIKTIEVNQPRKDKTMTSLQTAVRNQIDTDANEIDGILTNVAMYGADAGFSGFTYYHETAKFATENIEAIRDQLQTDVDSIGCESIAELVKSFSCIDADITHDQIDRIIYLIDTDSDEATHVLNALAFYALEVVAHESGN